MYVRHVVVVLSLVEVPGDGVPQVVLGSEFGDGEVGAVVSGSRTKYVWLTVTLYTCFWQYTGI
jgi:hypothetical protein